MLRLLCVAAFKPVLLDNDMLKENACVSRRGLLQHVLVPSLSCAGPARTCREWARQAS